MQIYWLRQLVENLGPGWSWDIYGDNATCLFKNIPTNQPKTWFNFLHTQQKTQRIAYIVGLKDDCNRKIIVRDKEIGLYIEKNGDPKGLHFIVELH